jgi:hypothetical protein
MFADIYIPRFYTYQFNDVNLAKFTTRTRALNNTLYWTSQIIGASVFGFALDTTRFRRTTRAIAAWIVLFLLTFAIWGGGYAFQIGYTRKDVEAPGYQKIDWTTDGYLGPMFLYIFYGFYDAAWQTCVYWYATSPAEVREHILTEAVQVHGSHDKQWSQARQLRWFLQGDTVRWCR